MKNKQLLRNYDWLEGFKAGVNCECGVCVKLRKELREKAQNVKAKKES